MTDDQQPDYYQPAPPPDRETYVRARGGGWLTVLPWIVGALIVLIIAVAAGLGTAYLGSQMNAAPPPLTALPSPTPTRAPDVASPSAPASDAPASAQPSDEAPPTDAATPPPAEATPRVHVVRRGESISLIALEYDVTPESIIELNELENPNVIVPGQELLIPPP